MLELLPHVQVGQAQVKETLQRELSTASDAVLVRETLRALGETITAPRETKGFDWQSQVTGVWKLSGKLVSPILAATPQRIAFGVHEILQSTGDDAWTTDEDAVYLGWLAETGEPVTSRLPAHLPPVPGGGYGAKRRWSIAALDQGPVAVLHDPFSESGGWGWRSRVVRLDWNGQWWRGQSKTNPVEWVPWKPTDTPSDAAYCFGELVVWNDGTGTQAVIDNTPYFLDDWELSDAVAGAMEAAEQSRSSWTSLPVKEGQEDSWTVDGLVFHDMLAWLPQEIPAYQDVPSHRFSVESALRIGATLVLAVRGWSKEQPGPLDALLRIQLPEGQ
ncbi:MAG: hypothetical protein EP343_18400 [Deltaproteobacteria bacterium]|nr:MAG: hypothetical protein EP343_18400 [Deltaproteobacteria bacterium]